MLELITDVIFNFKSDCIESGFFVTFFQYLFIVVFGLALSPLFCIWFIFEQLNEWSKTWFSDDKE